MPAAIGQRPLRIVLDSRPGASWECVKPRLTRCGRAQPRLGKPLAPICLSAEHAALPMERLQSARTIRRLPLPQPLPAAAAAPQSRAAAAALVPWP